MAEARDVVFHKATDQPNSKQGVRHAGRWAGLVVLAGVLSGCATQPSILDPHSPEADRIARLSWLLFGTAAVVFIFVTALLLIAIARSRQPADGDRLPPDTPEGDRRTLWMIIISGAVIPAVVLLILMGFGIATEQANAARTGGTGTIEVIAHQWWWEIHYPLHGVTTANELHIPVNTPFLVKLTSADVIHSFWIPQLHSKMDMLPGQTNTMWLQASQTGVYTGECAEYCGLQHAHMQFQVIVDSPDVFNAWLAQQQKPAPAPANDYVREGQQAFLGSACVYCHAIAGTNASSTLGPDLTHIASRLTLGAGAVPNNPGNLSGWIINSQAIKPGNQMPPMDLNSDQLQALLAYLATLK